MAGRSASRPTAPGQTRNQFGGQGPTGTLMGGTSLQKQIEAAGPGARLEVDMSPLGMQNGGYKVAKGTAPQPSAALASGGGSAAVAAPVGAGGGVPVPSKPPSVAGLEEGGGNVGMSEGAAAHLMSGPTQTRTNMGQRLPPSLAALLRSRVY